MHLLYVIRKVSIVLIALVALFAITPVNSEAVTAPSPQVKGVRPIDRPAIRSFAGNPISQGNAATRPDNEIVAKLIQATKELLDAIAPGNKSVW